MTKDEMLKRIAKGSEALLHGPYMDHWRVIICSFKSKEDILCMLDATIKELEKPEYPPELRGDKLAQTYYFHKGWVSIVAKLADEIEAGITPNDGTKEENILAAAKAIQARKDRE